MTANNSTATKSWPEKLKDALALSFALLIAGFCLWVLVSSSAETLKIFRERASRIGAENEFQQKMTEARSKSDAHHFLVSHWLQCKPILQTRASCYSSIRGAAAANGDAFVRQVDAAAKELSLI